MTLTWVQLPTGQAAIYGDGKELCRLHGGDASFLEYDWNNTYALPAKRRSKRQQQLLVSYVRLIHHDFEPTEESINRIHERWVS